MTKKLANTSESWCQKKQSAFNSYFHINHTEVPSSYMNIKPKRILIFWFTLILTGLCPLWKASINLLIVFHIFQTDNSMFSLQYLSIILFISPAFHFPLELGKTQTNKYPACNCTYRHLDWTSLFKKIYPNLTPSFSTSVFT